MARSPLIRAGCASSRPRAAGVAARAALPVLAAVVLVPACDRRAPSPDRFARSRVERLLRPDAEVAIRSLWQPVTREPRESGLLPRFRRTFERDEDDFTFTPVRAPPARAAAAPAAPRLDPAAASAGSAGLRFDAAQGAALWWLPARPESPCVVTCAVRRALAPSALAGESVAAAEERALVGRVVVLELERPARPALLANAPLPMLEPLFGPRVAELRAEPSARAGEFSPARLEFTTSARTTSLVIMLVAGVPGWWSADPTAAPPSGAVDFDELSFFELPLSRALVDGGAEVAGTPHWSAWRRDLELGDDLRPALVAAPPTEVRIAFAPPAGPYRLRFSYGIAEETRRGFGQEPVRFYARIETRDGSVEIPLPRETLDVRAGAGDSGWHECRFDGVGDGGPATLCLSTGTEGGRPCDAVALFAAPRIIVPAAAPPAPNVLLVSVDTLRADRVGARSGGVPLTPRLDEFARECVVFTQARALAPYTLPSHATLLTGLHPSVHGVERFDSAARRGVHPFLAQSFADAGCATAAFTGGAFLAPEHGLWHGFDRWSTLDPFMPESDPIRDHFPRRGEREYNDAMWRRGDAAALRAWIGEHRDEPFFLFVHTYLAHNYRPPPDLVARFNLGARRATFVPLADQDERTPTAEELAGIVPLYDATVAAADREVGALLDALRDHRLNDRTIVVVTSDHGEELGEHGGFGHGRTLHDEVLRVPLLVRAPGIAPGVVDAPVTLADVAPTLLRLAGLAELPGGCGRALLPAVAGDAVHDAALDDVHLGTQRALLLGGRKLIEVERYSPIRPPLPRLSLFDLELDPAERVNLVRFDGDGVPRPDAEQPPEALLLRARLAEFAARRAAERAALGVDDGAPRVVNPDLHALGYGRDR